MRFSYVSAKFFGHGQRSAESSANEKKVKPSVQGCDSSTAPPGDDLSVVQKGKESLSVTQYELAKTPRGRSEHNLRYRRLRSSFMLGGKTVNKSMISRCGWRTDVFRSHNLFICRSGRRRYIIPPPLSDTWSGQRRQKRHPMNDTTGSTRTSSRVKQGPSISQQDERRWYCRYWYTI